MMPRWACKCGQFVADSSITSENVRDDSPYATQYTCSRCGVMQGLPDPIETWTVTPA